MTKRPAEDDDGLIGDNPADRIEPVSDIVGSLTSTVFGTDLGSTRELPDEGTTTEDGRTHP